MTHLSGCNFQQLAETSTKVAREFNNVIADVEKFIKDTAVLTGDELVNAGAKLGERVAELQGSLAEFSDDVSKRAQQGAASANEYAHAQPWTIVAIGAAIGLVVGLSLSRR